jgi:hypothetical protein
MGGLKPGAPMLPIDVPIAKDIVYTPRPLAKRIIEHFPLDGICLDPCRGDGAFYDQFPDTVISEWCEIEQGRDFFALDYNVNWIVGNPPYSNLLAWIRWSFYRADNVIYLMPLHRVFASYAFIKDVADYGGIPEIIIVGTGTDAGFPFGHCLGVVHYKRSFRGRLKWTYWT